VSILLVERAGRVGYDAEHQPGRVSHDPPRMRLLYPLSAEALEPVHLGGHVIGVDVDMHAGRSAAQALDEQPEVLAV